MVFDIIFRNVGQKIRRHVSCGPFLMRSLSLLLSALFLLLFSLQSQVFYALKATESAVCFFEISPLEPPPRGNPLKTRFSPFAVQIVPN